MQFSIWASMERPWDEVRSLAVAIENQGWDGLWYADHYMPNTEDGTTASGDVHECFSMLAALAAVTSRIRLGSLVTPTTINHPALIANRAATIDRISHGRVVLGMGAGWQVNEHLAYGIDLLEAGPRVDRFAESIEIVSRLLSEDRVTFAGKHFSITDAPCEPKPVQSPLPILVGTGGPRMLRLTARFAQEWNTWGTPETAGEVLQSLLKACEKEGRDPATIRKSVQALVFITPDEASGDVLRTKVPADRSIVGTTSQLAGEVQKYIDAGFDEICVPDFTLGGTAEQRANAYSTIWNDIAVQFR
jgi:probable F420-dependent oxidoreductase